MNTKIISRFILASSISLALLSCNDSSSSSETTTTTDTTAKKEPTQPANDAAIDPAVVSPDHYKVIKDTLGIRVLEATYKTGDSSVMHSHPDNALILVNGGKTEFTMKDGSKVVREIPSGTVAVQGASSHAVKNLGGPLKVILVETTRANTPGTFDASKDAVKIAPDEYKMKSDSLGIRVIEVNYKPGQSAAMHGHPDNALYVVSGAKMEFTMKDGTKQTHDLTPGMILIQAGDEHSVKNVGKTTAKAYLVEVNRAR